MSKLRYVHLVVHIFRHQRETGQTSDRIQTVFVMHIQSGLEKTGNSKKQLIDQEFAKLNIIMQIIIKSGGAVCQFSTRARLAIMDVMHYLFLNLVRFSKELFPQLLVPV